MAATLRDYPDGMGGYIKRYPAPMNTRDANEWLSRVGGDSRGFKFGTKNNGMIQELKHFDRVVLRVSLRHSASLIPICQMASQKYGLKIDWYNPTDWRTQYKFPEDIAIVAFDE